MVLVTLINGKQVQALVKCPVFGASKGLNYTLTKLEISKKVKYVIITLLK